MDTTKKLVCPSCGHVLISCSGGASITGSGGFSIICLNCNGKKAPDIELIHKSESKIEKTSGND